MKDYVKVDGPAVNSNKVVGAGTFQGIKHEGAETPILVWHDIAGNLVSRTAGWLNDPLHSYARHKVIAVDMHRFADDKPIRAG